jgi:hypothetical protein
MVLRVPDDAPPREVAWARDLGPGTYVVSYTPAAGFEVRPATPPRLTLSAPELRGDVPSTQAPARVAAVMRNEGDEDAVGVPLVFLARRADDVSEVVGSAVVDVPAGETRVAEILWVPGSAGDWAVHVAELGVESAVSPPLRVRAGAAAATDVGSMLIAQGLRPFAGGAISASITLVAAVAVGMGFVVWRGERSRREADG